MKKLIATAILLASTGLTAFAADSKTNSVTELTANNASAPQIIRTRPGRWQQRRVRVVTRTRIVGRYSETIRTTYYPNGRVVTRVISRVRLRR